MTTLLHTVTGRMVTLLPIDTLSPILVCFQSDLSPLAGPPFAKVSLINITP